VKGIDGTYIGPKTHPTIGTLILVNFDVHPSRNLWMWAKDLYSPQRAIGKTPLTAYTFALIGLHKNLLFIKSNAEERGVM
jgi:hypothetical protein